MPWNVSSSKLQEHLPTQFLLHMGWFFGELCSWRKGSVSTLQTKGMNVFSDQLLQAIKLFVFEIQATSHVKNIVQSTRRILKLHWTISIYVSSECIVSAVLRNISRLPTTPWSWFPRLRIHIMNECGAQLVSPILTLLHGWSPSCCHMYPAVIASWLLLCYMFLTSFNFLQKDCLITITAPAEIMKCIQTLWYLWSIKQFWQSIWPVVYISWRNHAKWFL